MRRPPFAPSLSAARRRVVAGGGGAAYGAGSVAHGGEGGKPEVSAFTSLAEASLGMGYTLDEFIRLAGLDPYGDEIHALGTGGKGGDALPSGPTSGGTGGDGWILLCSYDDQGNKVQVDVFLTKGHFTIRRKDDQDAL